MNSLSKNASSEGRWSSLAVVGAVLSVATGLALALVVLVNATVTAHTLTSMARPAELKVRTTEQRVVVQNGAEAADAGVVGG